MVAATCWTRSGPRLASHAVFHTTSIRIRCVSRSSGHNRRRRPVEAFSPTRWEWVNIGTHYHFYQHSHHSFALSCSGKTIEVIALICASLEADSETVDDNATEDEAEASNGLTLVICTMSLLCVQISFRAVVLMSSL